MRWHRQADKHKGGRISEELKKQKNEVEEGYSRRKRLKQRRGRRRGKRIKHTHAHTHSL